MGKHGARAVAGHESVAMGPGKMLASFGRVKSALQADAHEARRGGVRASLLSAFAKAAVYASHVCIGDLEKTYFRLG